jgi:D-glycero-alpha-D-manno-heptose-7-phosphate kinase
VRVVRSAAPIRICDTGGWTDTWFAKRGAVFNVAVRPCAEVQVRVLEDGPPRVVLHAEDFGERYTVPSPPAPWGPHPLLEATIAYMRVPPTARLEISVHSEAPPGAGTGTSAAVTVALVGALDALGPGRLCPHDVARAAHEVETEVLRRQCGIQDQLASAYGGISYIEMSDYPQAKVTAIHIPEARWRDLERRLVLVYLGRSHDSSGLHERVIRDLESAGPDAPALEALRQAASRSRDAVSSGDFVALGRAMTANTDAQACLHPALVGSAATEVVAIARAHGALGWKVNGAGGEGGSLTLLGDGRPARRRALVRAIESANASYRCVRTRLDRSGLRVRATGPADSRA